MHFFLSSIAGSIVRSTFPHDRHVSPWDTRCFPLVCASALLYTTNPWDRDTLPSIPRLNGSLSGGTTKLNRTKRSLISPRCTPASCIDNTGQHAFSVGYSRWRLRTRPNHEYPLVTEYWWECNGPTLEDNDEEQDRSHWSRCDKLWS